MENRSMLARNSFASICVIPEQTFDWSPLFHINLPLSAALPGEGSKLRKKFDVEYDKPKTSFINRKIEKKAIIPDNNFHSTWIFTWTLQIPGIMRKKSAPDQLNSEKIEHWNMAKSGWGLFMHLFQLNSWLSMVSSLFVFVVAGNINLLLRSNAFEFYVSVNP